MQRVCAWSGPAFAAIMAFSLIIMGYMPPQSPLADPAEVAAHYEERRTLIRLGAALIMSASTLALIWVVSISMQLRRIEGATPTLAVMQLVCGVGGIYGFLIVGAAWTIAAFRPERDPEIIQAWNDFGWVMLLMPIFSLTVQAFAIGFAILSDTRARPLFPRWVGYANYWTGLALLPGIPLTFFKTGPFAWDGVLVFWLALVVFVSWLILMAVTVDRAILTSDEDLARPG
ncbi:MAG: hypothetical protein AAF909_07220 [Pseudomonadota bacterium]